MADEAVDSIDSILGQSLVNRQTKIKNRNLFTYGATPPNDNQLRYDLTEKRDAVSPRVRLQDPTGRLSGDYPKSTMQDIIDVARQVGVDPLLALSMAGQESNWGTATQWLKHNPLHDNMAMGSRIPTTAHALSYLKQRGKPYEGDPELQVQAYNGMGRIGVPLGGYPSVMHDDDQNFYGKPPGTLTGRKDRPYGKAVLGIRDWLKDSPVMSSLLGDK